MSRWVDEFNNHAFQISWKDLKDKLEVAEVGEASATDIEELARLKKAIAFLDGAIESIDPELIQIASLNSFHQQASACRDQIKNYNSNKNITHIRNANDSADNLLAYVRPYLIYPDKIKKSLLSAVRAYTKEMDKHLGHIADTEGEYSKAKEYRVAIEEYYNVLFEDENESIKAQIAYLLEQSEEKYDKLNAFYNETLIDEDSVSTKTSIEEAKKDILRDTEEANTKLVSVSGKIEELDKFYVKVFGSPSEDGPRIGGLANEIEERIEALEEFKVEQEKTYTTELNTRLESLKEYEQEQQLHNKNLFAQIESLLPGATSAGLAQAYQDMRKSFEEPVKNWNYVFMGAMTIMMVGAFATLNDVTTLEGTFKHLLHYLPLYVPTVWLAVYASKRRSENKRLEQEYAHKEAMAKSYASYKKQIEELKQEDKILLVKLIESSITTIAHNASESLDKKHGDNTPTVEVLKSILDAVKTKK